MLCRTSLKAKSSPTEANERPARFRWLIPRIRMSRHSYWWASFVYYHLCKNSFVLFAERLEGEKATEEGDGRSICVSKKSIQASNPLSAWEMARPSQEDRDRQQDQRRLSWERATIGVGQCRRKPQPPKQHPRPPGWHPKRRNANASQRQTVLPSRIRSGTSRAVAGVVHA